MTIASNLLHQHIQTFVEDNAQWQTLIADDLLWELPYAPSLGHPARLMERREVVNHVTWFLGAVEDFRFFDVNIYPFADSEAAVAEFRAEGLISLQGVSMSRITYYFCGLQAERLHSCANISIPCVRLRLWMPRFSVSNPEDNWRIKAR
jgi:hypothetical protein